MAQQPMSENRVLLCDDWANGYDADGSNSADFPFAGHEAVLAAMDKAIVADDARRVRDYRGWYR